MVEKHIDSRVKEEKYIVTSYNHTKDYTKFIEEIKSKIGILSSIKMVAFYDATLGKVPEIAYVLKGNIEFRCRSKKRCKSISKRKPFSSDYGLVKIAIRYYKNSEDSVKVKKLKEILDEFGFEERPKMSF